MKATHPYEAIVMGTSAGGLYALQCLLEPLPVDFPLPISIVQHRSKDYGDLLEEVLQSRCSINIKQADEKERMVGGFVYIAPSNYHLLIEADRSFSINTDAPVQHSRPSIDVLFESAAPVFRERLVAIILTGANRDGARGVEAVYDHGGFTIAQQPAGAQFPTMPQASIETNKVKLILSLEEIRAFLLSLSN